MSISRAHHILETISRINEEIEFQNNKWGQQSHSFNKWHTILSEEVGEAAEATLNLDNLSGTMDAALAELQKELVQIAAVAIQTAADVSLRREMIRLSESETQIVPNSGRRKETNENPST